MQILTYNVAWAPALLCHVEAFATCVGIKGGGVVKIWGWEKEGQDPRIAWQTLGSLSLSPPHRGKTVIYNMCIKKQTSFFNKVKILYHPVHVHYMILLLNVNTTENHQFVFASRFAKLRGICAKPCIQDKFRQI